MAWWGWALRFVGMGWAIALPIAGGTLLGVWLDRVLGTRGLLTIVLLLVGVVVAFYTLYRMVAPLMRGQGKREGH